MPTRPATPDPTGTPSGSAKDPFAGLGASLGAGLDFFQDWLKAAGSALPNVPGQTHAAGAAPGMAAWTMPTLDPAELDKRIQDLKTVQFWLEQNARMVAMTIQGLEVQRMTLSTLQGMNVSMDNLRDSLKASSTPRSTAPKAEAEAEAEGGSDDAPAASSDKSAGDSPELINPMRWWDTLTQQFTHLASQAAQTVGDSGGESMDMINKAQTAASEAAFNVAKQATRQAAKPSGKKPAAAKKTRKPKPAQP